MLRMQRNILNGTQLRAWQNIQLQFQQSNVRYQSQQAQRKSGIGVAIALGVSGVTAGLMGIIGYASWSEENRKVIDGNIPGIQYITDTLLGPVSVARKPTPPPLVVPAPPSLSKTIPQVPSKIPKEVSVKDEGSGSMKKEVHTEKKKEEKESTQVPVSAPVLPSTVSSTTTEPTSTTENTVAGLLDGVVRDANKGVTAALEAAERAASVVQDQAITAILSVESGDLDDAIKASVSAAITAAEQAFKQAQKDIAELATSIACSRTAGSSEDSLSVAVHAIAELAPAVVKVKDIINEAVTTMVNVELICRTLREARTKMAEELEEFLPCISSLDADKQLQVMLGHAYNRLTALQKQINDKQKVLEEFRSRGTQQDGGGISEAILQAELDRLRHQLSLQHRSDLGRQQDELEAEVRVQLKRQSAAHSEHLSDELTKQERDITAAWQVQLYDQITKEKDIHYRDVATIRGRLLGLQSAVTARADADRAAYAARQLWLACQSLRNAIRLGREGANSWDAQVQPLQGHLAAIIAAAGSDEFVHGIVGSVGSVATERGVYTEEALHHRFGRVATVARRVAMVPENGGSLLRYLLSYLQSVLLVQASSLPTDAELLDQPLNIHDLSTFDIIDRARACLSADDLLGGVRWLNQLTGESRRVAQDWCDEARRTLEMRLVVDALMAHAAATTATAL